MEIEKLTILGFNEPLITMLLDIYIVWEDQKKKKMIVKLNLVLV